MARHPATDNLLRMFTYDHLPRALQEVSAPYAALALRIAEGPQNAEATVALRKLLESKDAAVRAHLPPKEGPHHFEIVPELAVTPRSGT